jgi:hypothetical protein
MVNVRREALTCEPYVANSPAARTQGVEAFFAGLQKPLPEDLVNAKTKASLDRFVKQQAASICRVRLSHAFADYYRAASVYQQGKPAGWPAPPDIQQAAWCSQPDCSDIN